MCDCIDCEYVGFEPPRLVCGYDNRKEVIIGGDLALKHLYKECPLQKKKRGDKQMKEKATIPYEQLMDCIQKFNEDYTEFLCLTDELQISAYSFQLALYLSAKFYFDKKEKEE